MSEKFKIGDKAFWGSGLGRPEVTLVDGPHTATIAFGSRAWVVTFADGRNPKLFGENVLEAIGEWEPCGGAHRQTRSCGWERKAPND